MSYYIFFDESGKIDRQKSKYSYYGALGIKKTNMNILMESYPKKKRIKGKCIFKNLI